ncbi:hypothetical protein EJ110_NYTH24487 [Nymphaea thermarum]|nr:hypothetical protein EJ110_NYTH24487 [Nymphaea thermarum]
MVLPSALALSVAKVSLTPDSLPTERRQPLPARRQLLPSLRPPLSAPILSAATVSPTAALRSHPLCRSPPPQFSPPVARYSSPTVTTAPPVACSRCFACSTRRCRLCSLLHPSSSPVLHCSNTRCRRCCSALLSACSLLSACFLLSAAAPCSPPLLLCSAAPCSPPLPARRRRCSAPPLPALRRSLLSAAAAPCSPPPLLCPLLLRRFCLALPVLSGDRSCLCLPQHRLCSITAPPGLSGSA